VAARRRYDLIAAIATANLVCKAAANWLLVEPMGIGGVLLSSVAMYALSMAMFLAAVLWPRRDGTASTAPA
jgi:O-antigen/teichoic acid export membrane protein